MVDVIFSVLNRLDKTGTVISNHDIGLIGLEVPTPMRNWYSKTENRKLSVKSYAPSNCFRNSITNMVFHISILNPLICQVSIRTLIMGLKDAGQMTILNRLFIGEPIVETFPNSGLIFVVDSSDSDRLYETRMAMLKVFNLDAMKDISLLVFSFHCDNGAWSEGVTELEFLKNVGQPSEDSLYQWHFQRVCPNAGDWFLDGFEWLTGAILAKLKLN